jgi:hypothetical protein
MQPVINTNTEPRELVALQSATHTVTITCKGVRYKLFKIFFGRRGDIYINFPYYKNPNGLVGQAILKPEATTVTLDPDCSKVTSHLVKFAHHIDGETHFSQDGKVRTEIRKKALPLDKLDGHLFTVALQGVEGFEKADIVKYDHKFSTKKCVVNFDVNILEFEALKFVAMWNPFDSVVSAISKDNKEKRIGPKFVRKSKDGTLFQGFMISPEPRNPFNGYMLSLGLTAIPKLNKTEETSLSFIGGFDQNIVNSDPSKDYSFLVFRSWFLISSLMSLREGDFQLI